MGNMCQSIWMNHLSWTYHEEYVFQKTADGDDRPQFFCYHRCAQCKAGAGSFIGNSNK